jgi:predicted membrane protein
MKKSTIIWGLLFLLAGAAIIAKGLGFFSEVNILMIVGTVVLGAIMIFSAIKLNFFGVLFPLAFLSIIYDELIGITAITPWTVLIAALLGSVGLTLIFRKNICSKKCWNDHDFEQMDYIDVEDEGHIRYQTSFGSGTKYINSDEFEQADLYCKFGGMKVYFDKAVLYKGAGIIKVNVSFSGVELYIPKEWTVVNNVKVSMGAVEEKNNSNADADKTVSLVGEVSFGAVEIIYV